MNGLAVLLCLTAPHSPPTPIFGEQPGREIEHPMAIVIIGGLLSSTVLNLFFLPYLYLRYGAPRPRHSS